MARLYDLAMRDSHRWQDESLARKLGEATVIDGTNLSDYLYANEQKGEWNLLDDFFNIAPPFERFWVECRAPQHLLTPKGEIKWPVELPQEWGVLFIATELDKLDDRQRFYFESVPNLRWVVQGILFAKHSRMLIPSDHIEPQFSWWFPVLKDGSQPTQPEHECQLKLTFTQMPGEKEFQYEHDSERPGRGTLVVDNDRLKTGIFQGLDGLAEIWNPTIALPSIEGAQTAEDKDGWNLGKTRGHFITMSLAPDIPHMTVGWAAYYTAKEERFWLPLLQPCLMTVCFLHVKNILLRRVTPPAAVQKKAKKRHNRPLCSYHVLEIKPFRKILESEGSQETGIRRALHRVRAHFHYYGEQWNHGKLFGKLEGVFYVPNHFRGDIEQGLVDKSYKVKKAG